MMEKVYTKARIRVDEEGAQELYLALTAQHDDLLERRRDGGNVTALNRRLTVIRKVMGEAEATIAERGWNYMEDTDDGQLQPADAAGTGAGEAAVGRRVD